MVQHYYSSSILRDRGTLCGVEGEGFACRRGECPLPNTVVDLGQGVTFWSFWFVNVIYIARTGVRWTSLSDSYVPFETIAYYGLCAS